MATQSGQDSLLEREESRSAITVLRQSTASYFSANQEKVLTVAISRTAVGAMIETLHESKEALSFAEIVERVEPVFGEMQRLDGRSYNGKLENTVRSTLSCEQEMFVKGKDEKYALQEEKARAYIRDLFEKASENPSFLKKVVKRFQEAASLKAAPAPAGKIAEPYF